jgi:hypothetical protein
MQTNDGPKVYSNTFEKVFELIDKMEKGIGNDCIIMFHIHAGSLLIDARWLNEKQNLRYQFPIEEINQLKYEQGAEDAFLSYFIDTCKKNFLKYKETHND